MGRILAFLRHFPTGICDSWEPLVDFCMFNVFPHD